MQKVEILLAEMRVEHDPLAAHIFASRRNYRNTGVLKSGQPQLASVGRKPVTWAFAARAENGPSRVTTSGQKSEGEGHFWNAQKLKC